MSRYFVRRRRPRASDWYEFDDDPLLPTIEVADHEDVDTGLVDKNGETIMRAPNPMGFGKDADW